MSRSAVVPVGLVVLGALLYFPRPNTSIGGKDPGTYINEGVQIAQRGSLIVQRPGRRRRCRPRRAICFSRGTRPAATTACGSWGSSSAIPTTGEVIGQFPHLFPASIAIGYDLNGLSGARDAVGVWAILGLVAVYLVGARLFGPRRGGRRPACFSRST